MQRRKLAAWASAMAEVDAVVGPNRTWRLFGFQGLDHQDSATAVTANTPRALLILELINYYQVPLAESD
jgi:hypothetical protein